MRLLHWLDDHAYAIQGWVLGILILGAVLLVILGPHVGLAGEDVTPVGCHEVRC